MVLTRPMEVKIMYNLINVPQGTLVNYDDVLKLISNDIMHLEAQLKASQNQYNREVYIKNQLIIAQMRLNYVKEFNQQKYYVPTGSTNYTSANITVGAGNIDYLEYYEEYNESTKSWHAVPRVTQSLILLDNIDNAMNGNIACSSLTKIEIAKDNELRFISSSSAASSLNHPSNITVKCKVCGKFFVIGQSEQYWYKDHDLNIPKRCYSCRKNKN